jgi:pimeloyl-ACP methyl ester carboxylesterase
MYFIVRLLVVAIPDVRASVAGTSDPRRPVWTSFHGRLDTSAFMATPLHLVAYGAGTPVLTIHGWTPDHRLMSGCLEPVFLRRPGYRRLYPDLPGMGASPAGTTASSDDVLAALLNLVDVEIGSGPFLLIGDSYGGYLARAIVAARPEQVAGLALICPIGTEVENARRDVPEHVVLREDPGLMAGLAPEEAEDFGGIAVIQTSETLAVYRRDVASGIALADEPALERIRQRYELTTAVPESGPPYLRPTLILTGRQDAIVGYAEQFTLLTHYPRATYAVLDRAGHNLQIEQAGLLGAHVEEWLDRVAEASPPNA